MIYTYKIVSNPSLKAQNIAHLLKSKLKIKNNFKLSFNDNPDYLFIIGGDGTFIKHAVLYNNEKIKIIGINAGNLGFYSSFTESDIDILIKNLKNYKFKNINFLQIKEKNKKWIGLNELSIISNTAYPLDIYFNNIFYEKFRGTGILIGTRTGSTGYIKSAKGAIMFPEIEGLQFLELNPLLHIGFITIQSPIILPINTKIKIINPKNYDNNDVELRICLDGKQILKNSYFGEIFVNLIKSKAKFLIPHTSKEFIKKLQKTFIQG